MKITAIRAAQPPTPGSPPDWRTQLGQILVRIETDDGLAGLGVGGGGQAAIHVINTVLADMLVGQAADDVEGLYESMCRHTVFYGRSGLVMMAISGVDLALWDLRGRKVGQPVARLLNPQCDLSAAISTYCTVFDDIETERAIAAGHRAIKLHVERFGDRPAANEIALLVQRVRGVLGTESPLMIDAFARWDLASSLAVAEAVAPFDVAWLEEPLPPDDFDGYAELAAKSPVPIAGGEHEYGVRGFRHLIENRLHRVFQPDINWCGGMTPLVRIYEMAQQAGLRVCPHRGCEPYALHAIAALDHHPLAESPRTWFNCLQGAPAIENGRIHPNTAPGFGVESDLV